MPPSQLVIAITENPFFRSFKMPGRCSSILQVVHSKGLTWRYSSGLELRYQKKKKSAQMRSETRRNRLVM